MLVLVTIRRRLLAGDLSGVYDTIDAVLLICAALTVGTLFLNLLLLGIHYEK